MNRVYVGRILWELFWYPHDIQEFRNLQQSYMQELDIHTIPSQVHADAKIPARISRETGNSRRANQFEGGRRRLPRPHISHAMGTAVSFDLSMMNGQDFGNR